MPVRNGVSQKITPAIPATTLVAFRIMRFDIASFYLAQISTIATILLNAERDLNLVPHSGCDRNCGPHFSSCGASLFGASSREQARRILR